MFLFLFFSDRSRIAVTTLTGTGHGTVKMLRGRRRGRIIAGSLAACCLLACIASTADCTGVGLSNAWAVETETLKPDDKLVEPHEIKLYFLHIPKSGGTHFGCLALVQGFQLPDTESGQIMCDERFKSFCPRGLKPNFKVPFFHWDLDSQLRFFENSFPETFIPNEFGLGEEMIPSNTLIGSRYLKYVIILRNPLDRCISSHFYSYISNDHHSFANWTARHPPFTSCDDRNVHVQYLAGPAACGDPLETHSTQWDFTDDRRVCECDRSALERAKRRLESMYVVLILDWFHLSGDLLCHRLGWCEDEFLAQIERQSPNCGGRVTMEEQGLGWFADEWEAANAMDIELYEHAKKISQRQLAEAGIHVEMEGEQLPKKTCNVPKRGDHVHGGKLCYVKPDPFPILDQMHGGHFEPRQERRINATTPT